MVHDTRLLAVRVLVLLVFFAFLEGITQANLVRRIFLVPVSEIFISIFKMFVEGSYIPDFYQHIGTTLTEIILAYAIVSTSGVVLGFVIGWRKFIGDIFEPLILAFYAIPSIILYPVLFLSLGYGPPSKVAYGVLVGFFPVLAGTIAAVRQIDTQWVKVARSVGARTRTILFEVVIPGAAPIVIDGLRLGLALTIIGVLAGELVASLEGLGNLIKVARFTYETVRLFGLISLTIGLTAIVDLVFRLLITRFRKYATEG